MSPLRWFERQPQQCHQRILQPSYVILPAPEFDVGSLARAMKASGKDLFVPRSDVGDSALVVLPSFMALLWVMVGGGA